MSSLLEIKGFPGDIVEISRHFRTFKALMAEVHPAALGDGISRWLPGRACVH